MDLEFNETDNGGSIRISGNDVALIYGVENNPYLALFGGNTNYWANDLLLSDGKDFQFTSETEAILLTVPLNSAGRVIIEGAIKRDLQYLITDVPGTVLNVVTKITDDNRLEISITGIGVNFYMLWNPAEAKARLSAIGNNFFVTEDTGEIFTTEDGSEGFIME